MNILGKDPLSACGRCFSSCSHVVKCLQQDMAQHVESSFLSRQGSSCGHSRPSGDGARGGVSVVPKDHEAGLMKIHGPLTFLKVHDAGHMVPMDQPEASLEMLKRWMEGKLVEGQDESEEPEKLVAQM